MVFRYSKTKCAARLRTIGEKITSISGNHSHAPDGRDILKKKAMEEFKKNAIKSTIPRRAIVQTFCSNIISKSEALSAVLPQANSLLSAVNRLRVTNNVINPNPSKLSELKIPEAYKITSTGETFLLFDSGTFHFRSESILHYSSDFICILSPFVLKMYFDCIF